MSTDFSGLEILACSLIVIAVISGFIHSFLTLDDEETNGEETNGEETNDEKTDIWNHILYITCISCLLIATCIFGWIIYNSL